jgi:hypothetical protein
MSESESECAQRRCPEGVSAKMLTKMQRKCEHVDYA